MNWISLFVSNLKSKLSDPKSVAILSVITILSGFFHFYNLGFEYVGDETHVVTAAAQFLHGIISPKLFGSIFIFGHPPIRVLINIPFMLLFGTTEHVMRFPHALFGTLSTILVYLIGEKSFGRQQGIIAALLYAVSGVSAVNRQSQGVGVYTFLLLLALFYYLRYFDENSERKSNQFFLIATISLIIATYTYLEAVVFWVPIIAFLVLQQGRTIYQNKSILRTLFLYGFALGLYFFFWSYLPILAHQLGYVNKEISGNLPHILGRGSEIQFYNNIGEVFLQYVSYNSIFFVILLTAGLFAFLLLIRKTHSNWFCFFYGIPHFLVWAVLFQQIVMHPMYDMPFFTILAGAGLSEILKRVQFSYFRTIFIGFLVGGIVLTGLHNFMVHNQHKLSTTTDHFVFWLPSNTSRYPVSGAKAAGYYIRAHSQDINDRVFVSEAEAVNFYAGRLNVSNQIDRMLRNNEIENIKDLADAMADIDNWEKVKYLVITRDHELLWEYVTEAYPLNAVVFVDSEPKLYIFSANPFGANVDVEYLFAEQYEELFNRMYGTWQKIIPWFLPMVSERL